jgi:hypothetical protein
VKLGRIVITNVILGRVFLVFGAPSIQAPIAPLIDAVHESHLISDKNDDCIELRPAIGTYRTVSRREFVRSCELRFVRAGTDLGISEARRLVALRDQHLHHVSQPLHVDQQPGKLGACVNAERVGCEVGRAPTALSPLSTFACLVHAVRAKQELHQRHAIVSFVFHLEITRSAEIIRGHARMDARRHHRCRRVDRHLAMTSGQET